MAQERAELGRSAPRDGGRVSKDSGLRNRQWAITIHGSAGADLLISFLNADLSLIAPGLANDIALESFGVDSKMGSKSAGGPGGRVLGQLGQHEQAVLEYARSVEVNRWNIHSRSQEEYDPSVTLNELERTQKTIRQLAALLVSGRWLLYSTHDDFYLPKQVGGDPAQPVSEVHEAAPLVLESATSDEAQTNAWDLPFWTDPTLQVDPITSFSELESQLRNVSLAFQDIGRRGGPGRPPKKPKPGLVVVDTTLVSPYLALAALASDEQRPFLRRCALGPLLDRAERRNPRIRRNLEKYAAGCSNWFITNNIRTIYCCNDHRLEGEQRKAHAGSSGPNAARTRTYREHQKRWKRTRSVKERQPK